METGGWVCLRSVLAFTLGRRGIAPNQTTLRTSTGSLSLLYAPPPSLGPSLVPDADGFVFEVAAPGVHRLITDGVGHFPSATYIREVRDMDRLAVDEGRVLVWSTTHGIDNDLAEDTQLWVLGEEGVLNPGEWPPRTGSEATVRVTPDGNTWSLEDRPRSNELVSGS